MFECFCEELGDYLISCGKACEKKPSKKFQTNVYALNDLISDAAINKMAESCLFGYAMYFNKSNSFSVIVYYAGLVFVTDYLFDRNKFVFVGTKSVLFKKRVRRYEIIEELYFQFITTAQKSNGILTPELREKIEKYYKIH